MRRPTLLPALETKNKRYEEKTASNISLHCVVCEIRIKIQNTRDRCWSVGIEYSTRRIFHLRDVFRWKSILRLPGRTHTYYLESAYAVRIPLRSQPKRVHKTGKITVDDHPNHKICKAKKFHKANQSINQSINRRNMNMLEIIRYSRRNVRQRRSISTFMWNMSTGCRLIDWLAELLQVNDGEEKAEQPGSRQDHPVLRETIRIIIHRQNHDKYGGVVRRKNCALRWIGGKKNHNTNDNDARDT